MKIGSLAFDHLDRLVNWFIPKQIAEDRVRRQQARLFLVSHLCGPVIGNTVPIALFLMDPHPGFQIAVLLASILLFWVFPVFLKLGVNYNLLAILSIQDLIFCINWGNLICGGISSPTLPWFLTIPLLLFFYLGPRPWVRIVGVVMLGANLAAFYVLQGSADIGQVHISLTGQQILGVVSTVAAAGYVAMMASFYAKALASQTELEAEMRNHAAIALEVRHSLDASERAGAAKAAFLDKISDQSRAPLRTIIGYSELLIYDASKESRAVRPAELHRIREAGTQILRFVNDLIDLAKIETGQMEIFSEVFKADDMLRSLGAEMRPAAAARGNTLDVVIGGELGIFCSDMRKVRIVLIQLISNAIKFTTNGAIWVQADREQASGAPTATLVFRVRDTGVGIDDDTMETLFERFALNDDISTSKYGGSGLGLALSRKLCLLLGGDIAVETEQGAGSCFTVRIPSEAYDSGFPGLPDKKPDGTVDRPAAAEDRPPTAPTPRLREVA